MKLRRLVLACTAVSFAAIDLVHKAVSSANFQHARTPFAAFVIASVVFALVALVPRVPSNAASVGAGIACGGALGNLVSLLAWGQGVPDPLVVNSATQGIAFNLADVFALAGDALLLSAIVVHGVRHRARLTGPVG